MNITFHPNEFMLATAVGDRTVKFWDLESFRQVRAMRGDGLYYYIGYEGDGVQGYSLYYYHPVSLHLDYNHST